MLSQLQKPGKKRVHELDQLKLPELRVGFAQEKGHFISPSMKMKMAFAKSLQLSGKPVETLQLNLKLSAV